MTIREITTQDFQQFWTTFQQVAQAQETYAFNPHISYEDAYTLWCAYHHKKSGYIDTYIMHKELTNEQKRTE